MPPDPLGVKVAVPSPEFEQTQHAYRCRCGERFRTFESVTSAVEGLDEAFDLYIRVADEASIGHQPPDHRWVAGHGSECSLCHALDALADAVGSANAEPSPG